MLASKSEYPSSMFSSEGGARSDGQNRMLAGYLAFIAGFVNSSGFILIGTFTSHVTGNVGRIANDVVSGAGGAAISAFALVVSFFAGALLVSIILESRFFGHVSRAYVVALVVEAVLLTGFTLFSYVAAAAHPRVLDAEAALLCAAMGMQNALVTRLSGAVVRTTHLTGVATDLGIETARWFRYWRQSLSAVGRIRLVMGPNRAERPQVAKFLLLFTIGATFTFGAVVGALLTVRLGAPSMLLAAFAISALAFYAFKNGRTHDDREAARLSRR